MKILTILQAAALVALALYGAAAGANDKPACHAEDTQITCNL
ncbi:hypothetical protein [Tropicibacter oceani]|uniref:Uncharacterized protein n=1 Tax=Tropicibacter oceani TaxID=3058420 RepID=A0ABY8QF47_9RHOB|nr:hypothetical protein [Tropicibacter oceani]WGW03254.1 hypothetical protein QF118_15170 [Tropicibacter oceani]